MIGKTWFRHSAGLLLAVALTACGADSTNTLDPPATSTYAISGTVKKLNGTIVLQNNSADDLATSAAAADQTFRFPVRLTDGSDYKVTIKTAPANQSCKISNGSGKIQSGDVSNVAIDCADVDPNAVYTLGGSVSGLSGSLTLANGSDLLTLTADGSFTFAVRLANNANFSVSVRTQPSGQTCSVVSGSGKIHAASVTSVSVVCSGTPVGVLSVSDAPEYDFGDLLVGEALDKILTVSNVSSNGSARIDQAADLPIGSIYSTPIHYKGGFFPGSAGTCRIGQVLSQGSSCTVVINFTPGETGDYSANFSLTYHNGVISQTASRTLKGTGIRQALFAGGSGTAADPYLIANVQQLQNVMNREQYSFKMTADIDLYGVDFVQLGNLTGTFDGNGHTISSFFQNMQNGSFSGLFKQIDAAGTVKNLRLRVVRIFGGNQYIGALASKSAGTISNSGVIIDGVSGYSPAMAGNQYVGGLVGQNLGMIQSSYVQGGSAGSLAGNLYVGGLAGDNRGTIKNCYVLDLPISKTGSNPQSIGELVGSNSSAILSSYATVSVANSLISGLVGSGTASLVSSSYWNSEKFTASAGGGAGKTSAQLQQQLTFAGWDFTSVWQFLPGGYPSLRNTP